MNIQTTFCATDSAPAKRKPTGRSHLLQRGSLIVISSLGTLALFGCGRGHVSVSAPMPPQVVRVMEIGATRSAAIETLQFTGVVHARFESNLGFRVAGKITERLVDAGEAVQAGQPLLKLDPTDYQLALQAARAVQKQAALELERVRVLVGKRAESRDAFERAVAAAETSAAQAEELANRASYTTLYADADGIVMSTLAEPGQVVAAGQPVLVLAKDGLREAAIDIPEGSLEHIRQHKATAGLYGKPAATVPAKLREISGVADPVARTYQARYVLEGDPAQFPLGSTVTVRFSSTGEAAQQMVEIPLGSLMDRGDGAAVWFVDPRTSAVQRRAVSIAKLGAETALVSRGLAPGDLVVALGAQLLNDGEVVRVTKTRAEEAR